MDLQKFKEEVIKLNALSTEELSKFYRVSNRYQSDDGSEVTIFMMSFPKSLVAGMEMAYAIEHLVEWRDYQSGAVDNDGKRVYDDDMKPIDDPSGESRLPVIINNIDKLNVVDPLVWDSPPSQHAGYSGVAPTIAEAIANHVDMTYGNGKVSDITEQQVVRAVDIEVDVLDKDVIIELEDAYLILHWDSTA